jgi:hypothetical protein
MVAFLKSSVLSERSVSVMTTFDIELALLHPKLSKSDLEAQLPESITVEDRSSRGWGLVLRIEDLQGATLDERLGHFLNGISGTFALLRDLQPVVRIAAFNESATCTFMLSHIDRLGELCAQIEVSVYPTSQSAGD